MSSVPVQQPPSQRQRKGQLKSSTAAAQQPATPTPASPLQRQLRRQERDQEARQQLARSTPEIKQPAPSTPLSPHQRQGDRSGGDDPAAPITLDRYYRYADLKALGIIPSWPVLYAWIKERGFPAGLSISRRMRIWPASEVQAWLDQQSNAA
jgi:predicted DNA-binding transcriptional regulator AlpA